MRRAAIFLAACVLVSACAPVSPLVQDRERAERALKNGNCRGVDEVLFVEPGNAALRGLVWKCWDERQREIVPPAMARNDCRAVMRLPGIYPRGDDAEQRFVYHCWMRAKKMDLDTCIGMMSVGDASSRELIVSVLQRNPPERGPDPPLALIDTAGACLSALQRIENVSDAELRKMAARWGGMWVEWSKE